MFIFAVIIFAMIIYIYYIRIMKKNSIMIYSLDGCPYSMDAERIVQQSKIPHHIVKVSRDENLKNFYKQRHNMNTFPQIFYIRKNGNKSQFDKIGGRDELVEFLNKSSL